ncbi:hypothetical protein Y1Q_0000058 [Alligator mississippiensis]|uniref:Uncharacterized protein n=1 Tax=Alligator mississippiensis TaxID=8496 RepID=A0A151NTK9_ALLMI|nr:hypothetical protein Y1Q_0000058 [Alligator mississippiensis]
MVGPAAEHFKALIQVIKVCNAYAYQQITLHPKKKKRLCLGYSHPSGFYVCKRTSREEAQAYLFVAG